MPLKKLERPEWQRYFDELSKGLKSAVLDLEVVGLELGDQTEVRQRPLQGLSYDPKDDRFDIFFQPGTHSIPHPERIFVEEKEGAPLAIEILDRDSNRHIVKLHDAHPLAS